MAYRETRSRNRTARSRILASITNKQSISGQSSCGATKRARQKRDCADYVRGTHSLPHLSSTTESKRLSSSPLSLCMNQQLGGWRVCFGKPPVLVQTAQLGDCCLTLRQRLCLTVHSIPAAVSSSTSSLSERRQQADPSTSNSSARTGLLENVERCRCSSLSSWWERETRKGKSWQVQAFKEGISISPRRLTM